MRALSASRTDQHTLAFEEIERGTEMLESFVAFLLRQQDLAQLLMRSTLLIEVVGRFPERDRLPRVRLGFVEASLRVA